jgi:hypothetical protein
MPTGPLLVPSLVATSIQSQSPAAIANALDYALDQAYQGGVADVAAPGTIIVPALAGYTGFSEEIKRILRQNVACLAAAIVATQNTSVWRIVGGVGEPALQNSWTSPSGSFGTAQFRKEGDIVRLRGSVANGTVGAAIFTLPAGFIPPNAVRFCVINGSTSTNGDLRVNTDGTVVLAVGTNTTVSLDGICFSVAP